jgi:uncharacterized membrane protein
LHSSNVTKSVEENSNYSLRKIIVANRQSKYLFKKIYMAQKRKHHHHATPKHINIPSGQRTKGRIIWAILFAVFGLTLTFFAAGENWIVLVVAAIVAGLIGYAIGKSMEQAASE